MIVYRKWFYYHRSPCRLVSLCIYSYKLTFLHIIVFLKRKVKNKQRIEKPPCLSFEIDYQGVPDTFFFITNLNDKQGLKKIYLLN